LERYGVRLLTSFAVKESAQTLQMQTASNTYRSAFKKRLKILRKSKCSYSRQFMKRIRKMKANFSANGLGSLRVLKLPQSRKKYIHGIMPIRIKQKFKNIQKYLPSTLLDT
jgi:hypothetical protein